MIGRLKPVNAPREHPRRSMLRPGPQCRPVIIRGVPRGKRFGHGREPTFPCSYNRVEMPTVLTFWAGGGAECKYWLEPDNFDIVEDFEYNCTPRLRREVRRIIFEHFDQIVAAWREHFGEDNAE
jgi:hypothetical protein